jgi:CheY-like chemotaxis protein
LTPGFAGLSIARKDTMTQEAIKVLVVEDDPLFMKLVSSMLLSNGINVQSAYSAEEALDVLKHQAFGLLITDLKMEGVGGVGLIRTVLHDRSFPVNRILVITGDAENSEDSTWVKNQDIPILRKPFSLKSLVQAVDSIVRDHP